jgi:hypothetical protein
MIELATLAAKFGIPTVLVAAVLYILLHSDIRFTYPRKKD